MIRNIFYILFTIFFTTVFSGCGDKFNNDKPWVVIDHEQDEDENGNTSVSLEILEKEMLGSAKLIINYNQHAYQYQRANSIDNYAGYWTVSENGFIYGGPLPTLYTFPNPYLGGPFSIGAKLYPTIYNAYFHGEELGVPEWKAVAQIMYAYSAHEAVDFYGAMPYDDFRAKKEDPPINYQGCEEVYYKIFEELTEAVNILKEAKPTAADFMRIEGEFGGLSRGRWQNWVKFANSIKLRMAMNMVKINPADAQKYAEEAVNDDIGVLNYQDQDIAHDVLNDWAGRRHPLYDISTGWNDLRAGASIIDLLKHFKSPLLGKWFTKNSYAIFDKEGNPTGVEAFDDYYGIRAGVRMIDKSNESQGYGMYSVFSSENATFPRGLLKVTEVLFIQSEGALRGWNMGGTAKSFYEDGVRKVLEENGIVGSYADYISQVECPVIDHVDPFEPINNMQGRVKIGVQWNEQDDNEVKLEKIISQKYIANFPMSAEAWTTFRRTGYPRLYPVQINNWTGVDTELQLRRIPFIENDANIVDFERSLYVALGGDNHVSRRVWWDVATESKDGNGQVVPNNF